MDNGVAAPAVLLIHGNSMCWQAFTGQFESPLAQRYRMIAFDLPGHGASANARDPERSYSIPAYAELALEILDSLGIREGAILGWSLGGHIGLEIMSHWSGLRGLIIVGTPPVAPTPAALADAFAPTPLMAFAGQEEASPHEAEAYARACCGDAVDRIPALLEAARRTDGRARSCMMNSVLSGNGADGRRVAETATVPLAVVAGAEDPFLSKRYLLSLRCATLWRNKVHFIEDCGHAPFLDRPLWFNALFEAFLSDILH